MDIQKYHRKPANLVRNFLKTAIPVVLVFVAGQYTVLSVMAVREKMREINQQVDVQLSAMNNDSVNASLFEWYKEKNWLETRFQIARTDSISLSVNLKDSVVQLELKGVVLKTSKITDFKADQFFYRLNPGAYHHLFGVQAQTTGSLSTIPKEPLTVKKAPKDTTEVETAQADTARAKAEAVHWMMSLDKDVILKIEGTNQDSKVKWNGQKFWFSQTIAEIRRDMSQTIRFKQPVYQPEIRLVIPEADAKAIYRALPVHPLVCIRF
ncbi:hypothetical protein [Gaoshiqia sp. Z1-71]|uniref:hypothetical protein n=1 Tax=Gaoshiqia hydrogeniformans TaxID=3290090 RepID=UPI003BF8D7EB